MTYRLTRKAAADIRRIYLESDRRFGTAQADRYHARLRRTFDLLAAYPELARERRELSPPLRVHPCGSHVILYAVDGAGDVLIVRVRHAHEDWERSA